MEIQIPEKFEKLLRGDAKLQAAVTLSIAEFEPWLSLSGTPFFPEYTDHGPKHLSDTLATASAIIRDEAWAVVTSADVGALILSVLLHDCALHLTEDGFLSLVRPETSSQTIGDFDDQPWPALWLDFLGEASRFDSRKLNSLFGETAPAHNPGFDARYWTSRDKLLIGEFLRRHHARLAHEVAIWGVPTPADKPLGLKETPKDVADLAGLIARSHGQSIRSCVRYLERYDPREYKGIHAVFLMAVVRVSDYLQVQSDRAPEQLLRVRRLASPISQGEWKAHEAIRDIRNTHQDPEAVFIDAAPKDAKTYLKIKRLLEGIQEELDGSWAALGEMYGRWNGLKQLGLRIRRVRSNLDDETAFAKTVPYVPCAAAFEAADADLLSLLISPLYGKRPEIGIRELVQNSVDACRELKDYLQQRSDLKTPDLPSLKGDVVVTLEEGNPKGTGWLEVADRGIGMTSEVIRDYFLKAGASFRRSEVWRRRHESESGKSRVMRSGRFGIGALAAFLLGDEIEVSTRQVDTAPQDGIRFTASIDSSEIELFRYPRPIGTSVRIRISNKEVWEALIKQQWEWPTGQHGGLEGWDWYCLPDPVVVRIFQADGRPKILKQRFSLPPPKSSLPDNWRRISHPDYADIQWTYRESPRLTCNGIKVVEPEQKGDYSGRPAADPLLSFNSLTLQCPNLSVFDPDGFLPLLLQRTGLATRRYPFHDELLRDTVRDLLAWTLVNAPLGTILDAGTRSSYADRYEGFYTRSCRWLPFVSLPDGCSLVENWCLSATQPERVLLAPRVGALESMSVLLSINSPPVVIPFKAETGPQGQRAWFRFALCGVPYNEFGPAAFSDAAGGRMLLRRSTLDEYRQPGLISQYYWSNIREEFSRDGWVVLARGACDGPSMDFVKLAQGQDANAEGLTEWYLTARHGYNQRPSPIANAWNEILGAPVIPFNKAERERQFRHAFDILKEYVAVHEKLKQERSKMQKHSPPDDSPATTPINLPLE